VKARRSDLVSGKFYEFQGPLYDQSGKLRVPKGQKLSLNDIMGMNWFVKGVVGSPKAS
jgi:basic membrane protein A